MGCHSIFTRLFRKSRHTYFVIVLACLMHLLVTTRREKIKLFNAGEVVIDEQSNALFLFTRHRTLFCVTPFHFVHKFVENMLTFCSSN